MIGLSTAYALLRAGVKSVRILEQADTLASGTSFANAGMAHASLAGPWNRPGIGGQLLRSLVFNNSAVKISPKALWSLGAWGPKFLQYSSPKLYQKSSQLNYELAVYSLALNHEWREELNIQDDYQGQGLLKLYRSSQSFEAAKKSAKYLQSLGLDTRTVRAKNIPDFEPALKPTADQMAGALYFKDDFKADSYLFAKALEKAVIQRGGEILTRQTVTNFITTKQVGKPNTLVGVRCGDREFKADLTIICAGAKSYGLAKQAGQRILVRPIKGYSLSFDQTELSDNATAKPTTPFPKIPVVDDDYHTAITPLQGGLRIAGLAEIAGFDNERYAKRLAPLLTMLKSLYPQYSNGLTLDMAKTWHGFRPVSADGVPYIGLGEVDGLAVNAGHGHMGWTQSVGAAQVLADICLSEPSSLSARNYSICR